MEMIMMFRHLPDRIFLSVTLVLLLSAGTTRAADEKAGAYSSLPDAATSEIAVAPERRGDAEQPLSEEEKDFIVTAAEGNMAEIFLGAMAIERSGDEEVRRFAETLADHHRQANRELVPIAELHDVEWPSELKESHQQLSHELRDLSGRSFDERFVAETVKDHEKDVETYRQMAEKVEDDRLRQYIETTLPIINAHLEQARALAPSDDQASR
jgi:putative membrane protein